MVMARFVDCPSRTHVTSSDAVLLDAKKKTMAKRGTAARPNSMKRIAHWVVE